MPRLLDLETTERYLAGMSERKVRSLLAAGILRRVRVPAESGGDTRRVYIDRADLDRLIEEWKGKPD